MMKRHRQPLEAQAAINVTNLLDTAFILLVTFMLVTPQLTHSLPVDLPKVDHAPTVTTPPDKRPFVVTVQKKQDGDSEEHVYLKTPDAAKPTQVTLDQLRDTLTKSKDANPDITVVLESDKDVPTGVTVRVLAVLQEAKIDKLGISTDIERTTDKAPARGKPIP